METEPLQDAQREMTTLVAALTPVEGLAPARLDGVRVMRSHRTTTRAPVFYEPCVVVICQGHKRGYLGETVFPYDPHRFFVLSVPLPFESETLASEADPLLAVSVNIDLGVAAELALGMGPVEEEVPTLSESMSALPLDAPLEDTMLRLLRVLQSPVESRLLGPALVREVCFRVLSGAKGGVIRAALAQQGHFGQIAKALRRIHSDYRESLDVDTLAQEAHLSVAAFHAHFKRVTATSPMQYLKATRLHKARLLMIHDGVSASRAADRVGYESSSQFSREFKRLFGRTPVDEMRMMRATYPSSPEGGDRP